MSKIKKISRQLLSSVRILLIIAGIVFILAVVLAMTSLPYWARYRLGTRCAAVPANTQTILVMGAGGYPSETVLMRLYYTARLARRFEEAPVVISTPGDVCDPLSTLMQMRRALIDNGVDSSRILLEHEGLNTRYQALMAYKMLQDGTIREPLVVVSSPEHIYRCVRSFEKAGFTEVSGQPTLEAALETDLRFEKNKLGGEEYVPEVGQSITIRYKFWDYLQYEILVAREYAAIAYYKLKGWI